MEDQIGKRFDRLEQKIDRLTEVMTDVARIEEQIIGQNARLKRHENQLGFTEAKIEEITKQVNSNTSTARFGTALLASLWAAILGFLGFFFKE
tara:strand:- start:209 stop:487 length:279 start_codon:yes stop_codon:yes gene_type:complete